MAPILEAFRDLQNRCQFSKEAFMKKGVQVLFIVTALALLIAPVILGGEAKRPEAVASYGDVSITAEELDRAMGNRLMRIRTDEYNVRRSVLDELIAGHLVQAEAKRRGVTAAELLKAEVGAKVVTPAAAEVESFYEAAKERYGNLGKDEAIEQIIDGMRRQKSAARLAAFHRQLSEAANVRVMLEPPRLQLAAAGPTRGKGGAPVTIVEYSDFECPFCGRAAATIRKVESEYAGEVKVVYRDFPLPGHRGAPRAAEAAHCAGDQGKYWEMNDRLFSKGGAISESDIRRFASELQLDPQQFTACLDSGKHAATWKAAQAEGMAVGVQSTPTFFINGRMIAGAAPYELFAKVIDEELERAKGGRVAANAEGRTR